MLLIARGGRALTIVPAGAMISIGSKQPWFIGISGKSDFVVTNTADAVAL
jgi:hypothetical protein